MSFAYPAGAFAFSAVVVVLVIHFLQRRPRERLVTTLFLLKVAESRSLGGRRIERLRRSISLWLQLLTAALLAWLLMGPRQLAEDSVQKVAVVLDSTASMSVFRARAEHGLVARATKLARRARTTEWVVMESTLRGPVLYNGRDLDALKRSLGAWDPSHPGHDLGPALDTARGLAGPAGIVLLVTDRDAIVPEGVDRLAVGQPTDNVGFVGGRAEDGRWRALVRNKGKGAARRRWGVKEAEGVRFLGELTLAPGELRAVAAPFAAGRDAVELVLEGDAFPLDDRLPLVTPRPKALRVELDPATASIPLAARFVASLEAAETPKKGLPPDLILTAWEPGPRPTVGAAAIVFLKSTPGARVLPAAALGARHALVDDLDWTGLVAKEAQGFEPGPGDEVLLWAGRRPLVMLDPRPEGNRLLVNFPLQGSSASRVAAFPLLLHRFAESIRSRVVGWERANVETDQELRTALDARNPVATLEHDRGQERARGFLRAPLVPGFFRVVQGSEERLAAAAQFDDATEGDLTEARSLDEAPTTDDRVVALRSRPHPLAALGLLTVMGLLVADWALLGRRS